MYSFMSFIILSLYAFATNCKLLSQKRSLTILIATFYVIYAIVICYKYIDIVLSYYVYRDIYYLNTQQYLANIYIDTYLYKHTYIYTYIHIYMYIYMYIYIYIYTYRYILHCIHRLLLKYFCKSFTLTMAQYMKYIVYNIFLNRIVTNCIR